MRNLFSTMFGPGRYLNPRASGIIVFGGGGGGGPSLAEIKQAVKEYADPEFKDVMGGQGDIEDSIGDLNYDMLDQFGDLDSAVDDVYNKVTSGFNVAAGEFDDLAEGQSDIKGTVKTGFSDQEDFIEDQFDAAGTAMDDAFDDQGEMIKGEFGDQKEVIDEGFSDTQEDVAGARTDILAQLTSDRTGLESFLTDKFGSIENMTGGRFDSVDNLLDTMQSEASQGFTDLTKTVTDGQGKIQSSVDGMSSNLDTYYGDLSDGQANITDSVGNLSSNFTDFQDQYGDDVTLANRSRNDIISGLQNAVGDIQGQMGAQSEQYGQQLQEVQAANEAAAQELDANFADAARELAMGIEGSTEEAQANQSAFKDGLSNIRNMLDTQGDQLDMSVRDSYQNLSDAFDQQGRLIANSVDAQGTETKRAIDKNGNLIVSQFSQQGERISQFGYDINQMFGTLDSIYDSTIYRTGMMSPATQPYASTRG